MRPTKNKTIPVSQKERECNMKILYYDPRLEKNEKGYDPNIVDGADLRNRIEAPDAQTGIETDATFCWTTALQNIEYDRETGEITVYTQSGWYIVFTREEYDALTTI